MADLEATLAIRRVPVVSSANPGTAIAAAAGWEGAGPSLSARRNAMHSVRGRLLRLAAMILVGLGGKTAAAAPFVLTFEGLQDTEQILNFYNGGTGSLGSSGPNLGVSFDSSALGVVDSDAGGSGNFANEPSEDTIAFFLSSATQLMNVAAGFQIGFSFYYSASTVGSVAVYDGLNGTGNVLAIVNLPALSQECPGDPNGFFACWDPVGVPFSGTALSVDFAGVENQIGFDNITFGASIPIPEPTTGALVGLGLMGLAAAGRKRRSAH